jgi:hypothetical protein
VITECFRIDRSGRMIDTQYQLVSREESTACASSRATTVAPNPFGFFGGYDQRQAPYNYGNNGLFLRQ